MVRETSLAGMVGQSVGGYRLDEVVGKGGMGVVYRARQTALDREVCIKFLSPDLGHREEFRRQFEREAKTLAKLSHPNVLTVHDLGSHGDSHYLVTEFVRGGNLLDLRRRRALSAEELAGIVLCIGRGVSYIHRSGILHRDIKPSNILVSDAGDVRIVDFGIAMDVGGTHSVAASSGTLRYRAPEIIVGRPFDQKADQFSLAMALFAFMTGNYPECGQKPSQLQRNLPPAVDPVLERGMHPNPADRFDTVEAFCCALIAGLLGLPEVPATYARCPVPESEFHHGNLTPLVESTPPTSPAQDKPTTAPGVPKPSPKTQPPSSPTRTGLPGGGLPPYIPAKPSPPPVPRPSSKRWIAVAAIAAVAVLAAAGLVAALGGAKTSPPRMPPPASRADAPTPPREQAPAPIGLASPADAPPAESNWTLAGTLDIPSESYSFLASADGTTLYAATFHNGPAGSPPRKLPLLRIRGIGAGKPMVQTFLEREFPPQRGYSGVAEHPATGDVYVSVDAGEGKPGTVLCLSPQGEPRPLFGKLGTLALPNRTLGVAVAGNALLVAVDWGQVLVLDASTGASSGAPLSAGKPVYLRDVACDAARDRVFAAGGGVVASWTLSTRQLQGVTTLREGIVPRSADAVGFDPSSGVAFASVPGAMLRSGAGQGETLGSGFQNPADAVAVGRDTLAVSDLSKKRIYLLNRAGTPLGVASSPPTPMAPPFSAAVPRQTPAPNPAPPTPAPTPVPTDPLPADFIKASALPSHQGKIVVLAGTVDSMRDAWNERAPSILALRDDSGTVEVVFWTNTRARIDETLLKPGQFVVVAGTAEVYRDRPQLQLGGPGAIARADQANHGLQATETLRMATAFISSQTRN